jgi:hypothetical protein
MSIMIPLIIIVVAAFVAFAGGAVVAARKGYKNGGEVVARCRQGHLFMTVWVDRFSWHRLDVGFAKIQRCPVGDHLTVVRPVETSALSAEDKKSAKQTRDSVHLSTRERRP